MTVSLFRNKQGVIVWGMILVMTLFMFIPSASANSRTIVTDSLGNEKVSVQQSNQVQQKRMELQEVQNGNGFDVLEQKIGEKGIQIVNLIQTLAIVVVFIMAGFVIIKLITGILGRQGDFIGQAIVQLAILLFAYYVLSDLVGFLNGLLAWVKN